MLHIISSGEMGQFVLVVKLKIEIKVSFRIFFFFEFWYLAIKCLTVFKKKSYNPSIWTQFTHHDKIRYAVEQWGYVKLEEQM